MRSPTPSSTAQRVALARTHLTWLPVSRTGVLLTRVRFVLSGERVTYRPPVRHAEAVLADAGWTPARTRTAPELVDRYVVGSVVPTSDIRPIAFAVSAYC